MAEQLDQGTLQGCHESRWLSLGEMVNARISHFALEMGLWMRVDVRLLGMQWQEKDLC